MFDYNLWLYIFNFKKREIEILSNKHINQRIKIIHSMNIQLEGLMLKLRLQYFDHLMQRVYTLEKTLMLGKIEGIEEEGDTGWNG